MADFPVSVYSQATLVDLADSVLAAHQNIPNQEIEAMATYWLEGVISPAQITSDQNNYNPTGLSTAFVLRLSSDASRNITGLTASGNLRPITIHNVGSQNIVLKDESASSTAANRFALTADVTLSPDSVVLLQYDPTTERWRALNTGGGGTSLPVDDGTAVVKGSSDPTKLLRFEVDGFTTATTRVLTPPDYNGTIVTLAGTETLSAKTLTNPANTSQALTDGATVNWDTDSGQHATWAIGGNRTMAAPTNLKVGGIYKLKITQDGTGGRTVTWNSVFKFTPQPNLAASSVTYYAWVSDGTSLFFIGGNPTQPEGVTTITSSATPTYNTDTTGLLSITALAAAITSMTTNLSGTPYNGQKLTVRIKDNGTARAITWGASFEARGVALPTTTVISKVLTVGFIYDSVSAKWGCVASAQEA